jgi:hypothetical protein
MLAVVPATTLALVSRPCATVSTYALLAMSVEPDGVVEIVPVVVATEDKVVAPVTPKVVETVAAPVTVKAPVATARPAVRLATLTCLVVLDCTIGKTSVPARGVVDAGNAEILVFAMMI